MTFNDPSYSLNVVVQKQKAPGREVTALVQAEEQAKSEIEHNDDSDADDEHSHDDFNEAIFKTVGMPNHTPEAVIQELALIKKHTTVEGSGNICLPDDYATIHWTARIKGTKEIVEDSRKKFGVDRPKIFVLGHFDKVKCFDLIVPQMRSGESA